MSYQKLTAKFPTKRALKYRPPLVTKHLRCLSALKARIGIISTFRPVSGTPPVRKDRGAPR